MVQLGHYFDLIDLAFFGSLHDLLVGLEQFSILVSNTNLTTNSSLKLNLMKYKI